MYSVVATRKLTDKLTYVIQHDRGHPSDAIDRRALVTDAARLQDAEWYGVNQYLFYDLCDDGAE